MSLQHKQHKVNNNGIELIHFLVSAPTSCPLKPHQNLWFFGVFGGMGGGGHKMGALARNGLVQCRNCQLYVACVVCFKNIATSRTDLRINQRV